MKTKLTTQAVYKSYSLRQLKDYCRKNNIRSIGNPDCKIGYAMAIAKAN